MSKQEVYIATVALERNRWGSKEPSFNVSDWLDRFTTDGFDGVELWDNHYLKATPEEQVALQAAGPIAIYNSYVAFDDEAADARAAAAEAIADLKASAVKYNFGYDADKTDEFARNLLAWEKDIPAACALLCECHEGTALQSVEAAKSVLGDLDPERFGVIVHLSATGSPEWFEAFGSRVKHVHIQLRSPEQDPAKTEGQENLRNAIGATLAQGFAGTFALEFTRGIGKEESIDEIYKNACSDLGEIRSALNDAAEMEERSSC